MNTAVIIRKHAGHVIPRGYLQEALKNCPTCFGIAVQDKDDGKNAFLENSSEARTLTLDELVKTVETCRDVPMYITLGNMTQDFNTEDDLQPFVFQMAVEGEEAPEDILSIFVEGDFPNYSIAGGGHTDEYNLWEKFIFPTLLEKFDLANSDPEDFYNRLRASPFEQAIMNTVGHRAAVVFVPIEGEPISFGRNELGGEFDWGTTSNRFKYGDPTLLNKAAEVAVSAVKKGRGRLAAAMGSTAVTVPDKPEPKKIEQDANGVHHIGGTTVVDASVWKAWPGCGPKTHTMTVVPNKLQGNARNRWIRLFTDNPQGDLPKAKDNAGFMVPVKNSLTGFAQEDVSTNDDVKTLASSVKHFQTSGSLTPIPNDDIKKAAEVEHTAAPPVEKKIGEQRPASDFLPELSADAKKGTVDLVTEWATRPGGPTMLEIQRQETKWPKFSAMNGVKFEDMLKYTVADRKALCKKYPDAAALAWGELQLHIIESGVGLDIPEPGNVTMPKGPERQVEVPPAKPDVAPAGKKRSRLAQLSGQAA
jgi:hypothetical protein